MAARRTLLKAPGLLGATGRGMATSVSLELTAENRLTTGVSKGKLLDPERSEWNRARLFPSLVFGPARGGQAQGRAPRPIQVTQLENSTVVIEPARKPKTLHLFGAGHVARPTAHMASLVGFRVEVMDDRDEFANAGRFPDADVIRVLPDFNRVVSEAAVDGDSFVVVVTRGHGYDRTVLAQILKTEVCYIGMIGSRRKRDSSYRALRTEGFTHDDLRRVHCPIGLDIGAETPEEIAVSIFAELVRHRARGLA